MKKYYQLILIIVSFLSVTALIFYRHEYHRLRYVLEVLNFFGDPTQKSKQVDTHSCLLNQRTFNPGVGVYASWQRVSNFLFVYSAFWVKEMEEVKAIAVNSESESIGSLECRLWYEDSVEANRGDVRVEDIKGSSFKYLYCKSSHVEKRVPRFVSFSLKEEQTSGAAIPVLRSSTPRSSPNVTIFACTVPGYVSASEAVGFFAYHQLIGVTAFAVYGQPQYQGLNIINIPWNFPHPDSVEIEAAISADCYLRAFAAGAKYAFTLSWNQYIVPRYHRTLQSLFNDYTESGKLINFKVSRVDFCTEISDNRKTLSNYDMLPLQKTHRRSEVGTKFVPIHTMASSFQKIPNDIVSVHHYGMCFKSKRGRKGRVVHDPVFRRFDPDLHDAFQFWTSKINT
ncbi:uncharacterized protein LOC124157616 [Ischnura elegans]|uniref:uncharacterized protein LOC124157616 n=1 Tax=Ischnura elegans TaxID=197161 RepID=UPI001ED877C1|nr:uncharacterized protein LOC124157616 [Ischnura elegans]